MIPDKIVNWVDGGNASPSSGVWLDKFDPSTGELLSQIGESSGADVQQAVGAAWEAFEKWSEQTAVKRGQILGDLVSLMKKHADALADCIALETGKPPLDAQGEVNASILQGEYWAGEGMRLHGRSLTSSVPDKHSYTIRQPLGVAGLIVPANTPIANIAWKIFPALLCGNTAVLKASEDSPYIAYLIAKLSREAGLPAGVLNVVQGSGSPTGRSLVEDERVSVISFTGSTAVGRWIAESAGKNLKRVSLELGGNNPFVVCEDADIDQAVHWASLSAFSNAGQRCASASRIFVFSDVYDDFKHRLVTKVKGLRLGTENGCDLGPVINQAQHQRVIQAITLAKSEGGRVLCGGGIPLNKKLEGGYYIEPTLVENLQPEALLNQEEIFGPVATISPVSDIDEAIAKANFSQYGLTSAIHTRDIDRAMWFARQVKSGVANINLGTFGSEPHMPFGGFGLSGNGTREPGLEALDVYSELKNISCLTRRNLL